MKLMLVLKSLETNFNKQSIKTKIELIVFPLIIFILVVVLNNANNMVSPRNNNLEVNILDSVTMKSKMVDILSDFENFLKEKDIELNKISNSKESLQIEINTNLRNQLLFIKFVEDYNSFSKIKYIKKEFDILKVEIIFDKLYVKESFDLDSNLIEVQNNINTNLKLFAIIDDTVLINNIWLKKGDNIDTFKLLEIDINSVYLNNGLRTIELKIVKNENN
ncbi:hypothetical protein [Arcobacter sp. LA11]|uniref:hypothetical protein n=1 Tax=Arcobacter sp. LA11 TaxID=1898176 RepID=UPI00116069B0|nr:hypothetical protein [Arcobacter sp. LA11]